MKIRVTNSHIERGRPCHSLECPLAIAFYEATGECWSIGSVNATRDRDGYRFMFPAWLVSWIQAYDSNDPVQPMEFYVPPGPGAGA